MTAEHFRRAGVEFVRSGVRIVVRLPPGDRRLRAQVMMAIEQRLSNVSSLPTASATRYGTCAACGDSIAHYVAGLCDLCAVARRKVLADRANNRFQRRAS